MAVRPYSLRVNGLVRPLAIYSSCPEFSWKLSAPSDSSNVSQSACEVRVATSSEFHLKHIIWSSGKQLTGESLTNADYKGPQLKSLARYYWQVRLWYQEDNASDENWESTECSWFETGLLNSNDWRARWISAYNPDSVGDKDAKRSIFLYKYFHLKGIPVQGRAFATACGWYKLFINGHNVTGSALVPRWTPFDHYTEYQAYDITQHLKEGENIVSIAVADGRFRGKLGVTEGRARYGRRLAAICQIEIETAFGQTKLVSDKAWSHTFTGHIIQSDPTDGEHVDFRISDDEWLGTSRRPSSQYPVNPAEEVEVLSQTLVAEEVERVDEIMHLEARSITRLQSGNQIIDFGQNFTGIIKIQLRGNIGTKVTLGYSEVLRPNGELDDTYLMLPIAQTKIQRDVVILDQTDRTFQPWFTIYGFRYVEVTGLEYDLLQTEVQGIVLATALEQTGSFTCSDSRLNQLYQNVVWSTRSNLTDTATDCPTRERMGWTGDLQVFSPTVSMLFDTQSFLRRFLRNLASEQLADGSIPPYIPSGSSRFSGGQRYLTKRMSESTGWGDAVLIIPWNLYHYYGDINILAREYQSMKCWVDYIATAARTRQSWWRKFCGGAKEQENYILDTGFHFGEWLRVGSGNLQMLRDILFPSAAVSTAFLAHSAKLLSKIARLLDKADDSEKYEVLSDNTREAWRSAFVRENGKYIGGDYQDDYVRGLAFDLLEPQQRPLAIERLVELIQKADYHLETGFMSTGLLLPTLASNGRQDIAYRLLLQDAMPSWLYALNQGATTIWETWEGYDSKGNAKMSHNHYAFGTVAQWLLEGVTGLRAATPGYRRICIDPIIGGGLKHAEASVETPLGPAKSCWRLVEDGRVVKLTITVPPGATAEVKQGATKIDLVGSGVHTFTYSLEA